MKTILNPQPVNSDTGRNCKTGCFACRLAGCFFPVGLGAVRRSRRAVFSPEALNT